MDLFFSVGRSLNRVPRSLARQPPNFVGVKTYQLATIVASEEEYAVGVREHAQLVELVGRVPRAIAADDKTLGHDSHPPR